MTGRVGNCADRPCWELRGQDVLGIARSKFVRAEQVRPRTKFVRFAPSGLTTLASLGGNRAFAGAEDARARQELSREILEVGGRDDRLR